MDRRQWVSLSLATIAFAIAIGLVLHPYVGFAWEWAEAGPPVEHAYPVPTAAVVGLLAFGGALLGRQFGALGVAACAWFATVVAAWVWLEVADLDVPNLAAEFVDAELLPGASAVRVAMSAGVVAVLATGTGGVAGLVVRTLVHRRRC